MTRSAVRRARVVLPLVAAQLVLGGVVLERAADDRAQPAAGAPAVRGRPAPALDVDARSARESDVRELLSVRAAAVRDRDRAAFLATVDPAAPVFRARQAALFDALADVPLDGWSYVLDPSRQQPRDAAVDARRGPGWWAPSVTLRYRLRGFDDRPAVQQQWLTLVPRDGRWLVAADDDFAGSGGRTARALWDAGPVTTVQRPGVLVLGHPGREPLLRQVARAVQAAVPRVTAVWGEDWAQRVVVLVPDSEQELQSLVPDGDLGQIAAVATAEVDGPPGSLPVGDRVVVNPATFDRLGSVGRRVVLTHEVTHVATRSATGPRVPAWFVEGLADVVGYRGAGVPRELVARELLRAVRAGQVPEQLPSDAALAGGAPDLEQQYEAAWTAVSLLVERVGTQGTVDLYRAVGRSGSPQEVAAAWREHARTTPAAFTDLWRASLVDRA